MRGKRKMVPERAPGNRCSFWKTSHVAKNDDIAGLDIWLFVLFCIGPLVGMNI